LNNLNTDVGLEGTHQKQVVLPILEKASEAKAWYMEYMKRKPFFDPRVYLAAGKLALWDREFARKVADTVLDFLEKGDSGMRREDVRWAVKVLGACSRSDFNLGWTIHAKLERLEVAPGGYYWHQLLSACVAQRSLDGIRKVARLSGLEPRLRSGSAKQPMLDTYLEGLLEFGLLEEAEEAFNQIPLKAREVNTAMLLLGELARRSSWEKGANLYHETASIHSLAEVSIEAMKKLTAISQVLLESPEPGDILTAFSVFKFTTEHLGIPADAIALGIQLSAISRCFDMRMGNLDDLRHRALKHSGIVTAQAQQFLCSIDRPFTHEELILEWRVWLVDVWAVLNRGLPLEIRKLESWNENRLHRALIGACAKELWREGFERVRNALQQHGIFETATVNTLIEAYGAFGMVDESVDLFNNLNKPTLFSYLAIIKALGVNRRVEEAFHVYEESQNVLSGTTRSFLRTALMEGCIKGGDPDRAFTCIDGQERLRDLPLCHVYLKACAKTGDAKRGDDFISRMIRDRVTPDHKAFNILIWCHREACEQKGWFKSARQLKNMIAKHFDVKQNSQTLYQLLELARAEDDREFFVRLQSRLLKTFGFLNYCEASFYEGDRKVKIQNGEDARFDVRGVIGELATVGEWPFLKKRSSMTEVEVRHLDSHAEKRVLVHLLKTRPPGESLYLTISLRMCSDCHLFFEACAVHYNRTILAQDADTLHNFNADSGRSTPKPWLHRAEKSLSSRIPFTA